MKLRMSPKNNCSKIDRIQPTKRAQKDRRRISEWIMVSSASNLTK